jgi:hypothetical protein
MSNLANYSFIILNKKCPCGAEFETYHIDNLYCSPDCKEKFRPKKHHAKCKGGWSY